MATRKRTTARRSAGTEPLNTSVGDTRKDTQSHSANKGADDIRAQLADHVGALRFVTGALGVCVQALKQQSADMDEEIALVLQRTVGDTLDRTTDRIEAIALGIELEEA